MTEVLDVRALSCPGPVIELRKLLEDGAREAILWVADDLARSNVTRFATTRGATVRVERHPASGHLVSVQVVDAVDAHASPSRGDLPVVSNASDPTEGTSRAHDQGARVVQLTADTMGAGDDELGTLLLRGFVKTVLDVQPLPDMVLCYNGGVRLCCEGSPVLDDLRALEAQGCSVIACGTCLGFYDLTDQLAAGRVTDMLEIVTALSSAAIILRP